jgi:hypothetical protein
MGPMVEIREEDHHLGFSIKRRSDINISDDELIQMSTKLLLIRENKLPPLEVSLHFGNKAVAAFLIRVLIDEVVVLKKLHIFLSLHQQHLFLSSIQPKSVLSVENCVVLDHSLEDQSPSPRDLLLKKSSCIHLFIKIKQKGGYLTLPQEHPFRGFKDVILLFIFRNLFTLFFKGLKLLCSFLLWTF